MTTNQPPETQMSLNVNLDTTPILYTDNVFMTTNSDGLVIDFCQKLGSTNTTRIVARIGMSREHAKKVIAQMGKLLALTQGHTETGQKKEN